MILETPKSAENNQTQQEDKNKGSSRKKEMVRDWMLGRISQIPCADSVSLPQRQLLNAEFGTKSPPVAFNGFWHAFKDEEEPRNLSPHAHGRAGEPPTSLFIL